MQTFDALSSGFDARVRIVDRTKGDHHLPRRIERCVSVEAAGVWGSAYCASAHLADAKSRELVEVTTAS